MAEKATFQIGEDGTVTFSEEAIRELDAPLELAASDEAPSGSELDAHGVFGSKHTYCCVMGNDGGVSHKQQFRSYSWQAPVFCVRMARNKGYNSGSVSRGECTPDPEE